MGTTTKGLCSISISANCPEGRSKGKGKGDRKGVLEGKGLLKGKSKGKGPGKAKGKGFGKKGKINEFGMRKKPTEPVNGTMTMVCGGGISHAASVTSVE